MGATFMGIQTYLFSIFSLDLKLPVTASCHDDWGRDMFGLNDM